MRAGMICWNATSATRPISTPITSAPSRHLHVGRSPGSRQTPAIFRAQNQMKPIATVMTPTIPTSRRSVGQSGVSNACDSEGAGPASQKLRAMAPSVSGSTIQTTTAVRRTYHGAFHFAPSDLLSRLLRLYGSWLARFRLMKNTATASPSAPHASRTFGQSWRCLPGPREQPRQKQDDGETEQDDREVEDEVAQVGGHRGQRVRAEDPRPRGEVVAVAPEERDLPRLLVGVILHAELLLHGVDARAMDPGREPAADVAPARHRGEVVELLEKLQLGEGLEHAEVERGAADPAAREGQPQELVLVVRPARSAPGRSPVGPAGAAGSVGAAGPVDPGGPAGPLRSSRSARRTSSKVKPFAGVVTSRSPRTMRRPATAAP